MLAGTLGCGASGAPGTDAADSDGGGGGDGSYEIAYRAGSESLLDLRVDANFELIGEDPGVPEMTGVQVAQASAIVLGNGQQTIEVNLSTGTDFEHGDRFYATLEFSRANQGEVIDNGGTLAMSCNFAWYSGADYAFASGGECDVRRSGGGYSVSILQTTGDGTQVAGDMQFAPVPNSIDTFTPGYGCADGDSCLSLDPDEYDPETGFCMPTTNLKSLAAPCTSECGEQLQVEVGGTQTCICTSVCGRVDAGGGGDPPTCDPAYGCVDF